ncbi:uncharacterized protein Dere_GG27111 [Drosophila erecta]|uniref:Uncharacterized protein n=1 Tax=Drosophila erecta TaxID=7220 RepID=A0A0Q5QIU8_DROER|nr:uncharacterized protein Dere_GG27111 [Drosophila erecta]
MQRFDRAKPGEQICSDLQWELHFQCPQGREVPVRWLIFLSVTKKSKNRWRDSNYDERATKQLSPEKNQANFQIKRDPIKMHHGVKGDSDVNGRSDEQLKWDPAFNKMTLVGKNVNEATKNEDSETPFRKERKRRNTPNSDKTSQGHSSKNTDKSKAAKGVFKRGHGRYRCKSLGYMKEHLRFGRFVCPSDLLRVKLEERDLYRCIPYCNTSLYQTCMPYKFRYQCCAAP